MTLLSLLRKDKNKSAYKLKNRKESKSLGHSHSILSSNVTRQFYITLEEPHRIWKPNELIIGETTLEIKKDITNVAIRLSLISEIKVRTGYNAPSAMKTKKTTRLIELSTFLYGFDMAQEFNNNRNGTNDSDSESPLSENNDPTKEEENEQDLDSENDNIKIVNGLTKSVHKFPFKIKIPKNNKNLFSSLKFEKGCINYYLQCTLEPLSNDQSEKTSIAKCRNDFAVIVPLDVSNLPIPKTKTVVLQPFSTSTIVHKKSNSSGDAASSMFSKSTNKSTDSNSSLCSKRADGPPEKTVSISVGLSRSGFVMGEVIPIKISLQHYKPYFHAAGVITTLVRVCRVGTNDKNDGIPIEKFRKDICQCVSSLYVDPESLQAHILVHLKVPLDAFATFNPPNQLFSFQYYIEVMVNLSRKNIVYTESHKILGGTMDENDEAVYHSMNNKNKTNKISSSKLYGIEKNIQKKVFSFVNNTNDNDDYDNDTNKAVSGVDDNESKILYNDMINVENLKGLRNVTGMSIEIVIGTVKANEKPERLKLNGTYNTETNSYDAQPTSNSNEQNIDPSATTNISIPAANDLNNWLSNYPHYDYMQPVPEYSPVVSSNSSYKPVSDDKQELERSRLQALESEPPEEY